MEKEALTELSDEDRMHIEAVFEEEIVPKLKRLGARLGPLTCDFAGEQYRAWTLHFRSAGSTFEIVEYEYDENGAGLDLDL